MPCHQGNMISYAKLPKYMIELYLLFLLYPVTDCISVHPMGKYTQHHDINHISTVQPEYPWANSPSTRQPQVLTGHNGNNQNLNHKSGSFSDLFGANRQGEEIQVISICKQDMK